jgi:hypothetical protein
MTTGRLLMADLPGGRISKYYSQSGHTAHNLTCHQYDFMIQREMCMQYDSYVWCVCVCVCVCVQLTNMCMVYNDNKCHMTDCIAFASYRQQVTSPDRPLVSSRFSTQE